MDTNKGIKILRIVSLTLGIISMLLFLYAKIAHAEENRVPFPSDTPYYPSWDYSPFKDNVTVQNNIINSVKTALQAKGYNNNPDFMLCVNSLYQSEYQIEVYFNAGKNNGRYEYGTYQMAEWLNNETYNINILACSGVIYVTTNGELSLNSIPQAPSANSYNNPIQDNRSSISLKVGDINNGIVVYSTNHVYDMTGQDADTSTGIITIAQSGAGVEEVIQAEITGIFENTELIAQAGSQTTDTLDTLKQSTLKSWLQAIIDSIWKSANNKVQNLTSFFSPTFNFWSSIWSHIKDTIDNIKDDFESLLEKVTTIVEILQEYVANDFTAGGIAQVWETNYTNSHINTLVETGEDIKDALLELGDVEPNEPIITVNIINNTFFGTTEEYQFNFTWYNNIKTPILTFITAFWLVGLGLHLFTQIPNMIHGVSGTAHGIQNATPTETYSHKDIYH